MSNTKDLDNLNQKIAKLMDKKKQIEDKMISKISKHIASFLVKKHASDIDIKDFIKRIEPIVDEMQEEKFYEELEREENKSVA